MYPCQHRQITAAALRQFSQQNPNRSPLTTAQQEAIIVGSDIEDAPSGQRISNWHFFRSNEKMPSRGWPHLDSRGRVQALQDQLRRSTEEERYELIGRLLHHIQDMSTPSHVTPIYHDALFSDPYEGWLKQQVTSWPTAPTPLPPNLCAPRSTAPGEPLDHYYQACAEATLRWLADESQGVSVEIDGRAERLPLQAFWPLYGAKTKGWLPGFASFGPLGREFGKTEFQAAGHHYRIDEQSYRQLAELLLAKACEESQQALHLLLP